MGEPSANGVHRVGNGLVKFVLEGANGQDVPIHLPLLEAQERFDDLVREYKPAAEWLPAIAAAVEEITGVGITPEQAETIRQSVVAAQRDNYDFLRDVTTAIQEMSGTEEPLLLSQADDIRMGLYEIWLEKKAKHKERIGGIVGLPSSTPASTSPN